MKKRRVILIASGALLATCCGLVGLGAILSNTPFGQATSTAQVLEEEATREEQTAVAIVETATRPPTRGALATLTPTLEKTAIVEPTNTSRPTSPPTAATDTARQEYELAVLKAADGYSTGLQSIGELFSQAGENPSIIFDEDWRVDVVVALVMFDLAGASIRELTPPPGLEPTHEHLLEAADHFDQVVTLTTEGIDELDADKIAAAQEEILLGTEAFGRATETLQAASQEANVVPAATNTTSPATATNPPPPTQPLATIPIPTNTSAPPPAPAGPCSCSGPDLDCGDFGSRASAQACHDHCVATVGYDYHGLDGNDNDGLACESLP